MKSICNLFICLCITVGVNNNIFGQIDKIMTYNIKYDDPSDSINKWDNRKEEMIDLIDYYEPDVFGIQEGLLHQLTYLDKHLPSYSRIGVGRDDGKEKGEFCAIYYNHKELSLLKNSTFWLSQKRDSISVGWDASMERICTYGLFENKITNKKLWVFNTHYDHIGKISREKSSELILQKIKEINIEQYPVVLMGDFNAEPNSPPIKIIIKELKDGASGVENGIYGPIGTFTGFKKHTIAKRRIDYIFVKGLDVVKYRHIDDLRKNTNYLSDHLPVIATFKQ